MLIAKSEKQKTISMKNVRLFLTAVALFIGTSVFSQQSAVDRATAITERMATELALTPEQKGKVQALNLAIAEKNDAVRNDPKLTKEQKAEAIKGNQTAREAELKPILTTEQLALYQKLVEKWKAERASTKSTNKANTRRYVRKSVTVEDL
jgi:hypothetical protein